MGVCDLIRQAMIKHGLLAEEASANFWVLDKDGLITASREGGVQPHVQVFARTQPEEQQHDGDDLLAVVKRVKPTGVCALKRQFQVDKLC
jgi:malate dehydrogenase (oxaloacetate-decarboxylating)